MDKVKIPITYLVLAILSFLVIGLLRQNYNNTVEKALKQAKLEEAKRIEEYCDNVDKISDFDFAIKRGEDFFEAGKYQQAAAVFDRATSFDKNYRDSWFWGGYAHLKDLENRKSELPQSKQREILEKAKADLEQAHKIDPLYTETIKLLAEISKSENNDKEKRLWYARYETVTGEKLSDVMAAKTAKE